MFFEKKIDLSDRQKMVDFLTSHFRYNTMNSWNRSTSYANCVKLYQLELEKSIYNKAFEIIYMPDFTDAVDCLIIEYTSDKSYAVGFNGSSSGYLVMYKKGLDGSVYPGRSIDQEETFEDWDIESIRQRVEEVVSFDNLCDRIRSLLISYCEQFDVKEQTIMVPKKRKVLERKES